MKGLIAALLVAMALTLQSAETFQLSNSHLQLQFDSATGGLIGFASRKMEHQFIEPQTNNFLWEIRFHNGNGKSQTINSTQAKSFYLQKMKGDSTRLIWENFDSFSAPKLQVEAEVELDKKTSLSRWKISLHHSEDVRFDEVKFPCIQNISAQENEFLAVPTWMGLLAKNPREMLNKAGQNHELHYEYPGLTSLQCFAFYQNNGPGFYFSADDTNAFHKAFIFSGDGKGAVNFSFSQLPENKSEGSGDYVQQYHAVLGTFSGDWFTAAEIYRSWATNQWWAHESRLQKNESNWARETALWVWNRGPSENVIQPALALQEKLKLPVSAILRRENRATGTGGMAALTTPVFLNISRRAKA